MAALAERFVRIRVDSKGFATELRNKTQAGVAQAGARAGSDWGRSFGRTAATTLSKLKLTVKVTPDFSGFGSMPNLPSQRVPRSSGPSAPKTPSVPRGPKAPKVPIELDPLVSQFQAQVRREVAKLSTQVNAKIPVSAETENMRRDIARRIAEIEKSSKVKVAFDNPDGGRFVETLRSQIRGLERDLKPALNPDPAPLSAFQRVLSSIFGSASGASSSLSGLAGGFGSLSSAVASTPIVIGAAIGAISALPAIIGSAVAALYALGGALGSLPALSLGLGASVGVLGLGFAGLSDRFKKISGGGGGGAGGVAKSLSGVKAAQRSVLQSTRELTKATLAINKARAEEVERIDDLGRALRGSVLDEEDAVAAVAEARAELAKARGEGDVNAIGAADRAYRRSLLTLDEARDKTGDLAAEKADADKKGVEGSDAVQDAIERQRDATERLQAATDALAEAQKALNSGGGGGGGAAQSLMKIAPAAQEVVDAIKRLKPAFEDLRLSVQQRLFDGIGKEITKVATVWLPQLKKSLGDYATTFNGLAKNLSGSITKPKFVTDVAAGLESVRGLIDKVGTAVTGPLVGAFGTLSRAAAPFINMLGDKIAGLVTSFSAWIDKADKSGALSKFFSDAAYYLGQIWDIGGSVFSIVGQLFSIFTGTNAKDSGDSWLVTTKQNLDNISAWLKDPANQQKVTDFINGFTALLDGAVKLGVWINDNVIPVLISFGGWIASVVDGIITFGVELDYWGQVANEWFSKIGRWVGEMAGKIGSALGQIPAFVSGLGGRISAAASGIWDGIKNTFRDAINFVISGWNRLSFRVPKIEIPNGFGGSLSFGGGKIGVDPIQRLAKGGVARARPGGILANIAEGGKDEAVSPVDVLQGYIADAVTSAIGAVGAVGQAIIVHAHIYLDSRELKGTVVEAIAENPVPVARANNVGAKRLGFAG